MKNKIVSKVPRRSIMNNLIRGAIYRIDAVKFHAIEFFEVGFDDKNQKFINVKHNDLVMFLEEREHDLKIGFPKNTKEIEIPKFVFVTNQGQKFWVSVSDVERFFHKVC